NQNACPPFAVGVTGYKAVNSVFLHNPSFHNFDPRLGVAWDPFKDHKTSVRVGYGIFHDLIVPYDFTTGFSNAPAGTGVTQICGACSAFPTPFQVAGGFSPAGSTIDVGNKTTGYVQQYNLTVQRE